MKPSPASILVAADIQFPAPPGARFDLDDIDIFNADTGESFGSGSCIQRLTPAGEFVADDDPEVRDRLDWRGIFVWEVPVGVKRVNFGYWGEMLFVKPFPVQKTGRTIPESRVSMTVLAAESSTEQFNIYRGILRAQNWYRAHDPSGYTLTSAKAPKHRSICDSDVWIEIDSNFRPIDIPVAKRAYVIPDRYFLIEYWCPVGTQPDELNLYGDHFPLPALRPFKLPTQTLAALRQGHKNSNALHRVK